VEAEEEEQKKNKKEENIIIIIIVTTMQTNINNVLCWEQRYVTYGIIKVVGIP
jgi:hypothetical protein